MSKEVLILKAGDWQAGVDPDYGANLVFLRYAGRDVLRPLTQGNWWNNISISGYSSIAESNSLIFRKVVNATSKSCFLSV